MDIVLFYTILKDGKNRGNHPYEKIVENSLQFRPVKAPVTPAHLEKPGRKPTPVPQPAPHGTCL
jgi:hypothetical protein